MTYRVSKNFKLVTFALIVIFFVVLIPRTAWALECEDILNGEAPSPIQLLCPAFRLLNVLVLTVGAIFVIMILYAGIKLSTSLGDPKGFQGAYQTGLWAFIGGFIILAFYVLVSIILGLVGVEGYKNPSKLTADIEESFNQVLCNFCIEDTPGACDTINPECSK